MYLHNQYQVYNMNKLQELCIRRCDMDHPNWKR